jgi:glycosyltransferase involved in cell wall biosynthesis
MRVLIVVSVACFHRDRTRSGSLLRARHVGRELVHYGIDVAFACPKPLPSEDNEIAFSADAGDIVFFESQAELHPLIVEGSPRAILVGDWELLEHFPDDLKIPLILDASVLYNPGLNSRENWAAAVNAGRMLTLLRKASRFTCETPEQRQGLIPWLTLAGFDCRGDAPIDIIPIPTELLSHGPSHKRDDPGVIDELASPPTTRADMGSPCFDVDPLSASASEMVGAPGHDMEAIGPLLEYLRNPSPPPRVDDELFGLVEPLLSDLSRRNVELDDHVRLRDSQLGDLRLDANGLRVRLEDVEQSASWRLTAPLRALAGKSRGLVYLLRRAGSSVYRRGWKHPGPRQEFALESGRYSPRPAGSSPDQWFDRKGRYVAILSREDVFPTNHGAAVKVERTAWGLSHFVDGVFLITGDWGRYYEFKNGSATEKYFPLAVRLSGVSGMLLRKKLLRTGIPINEAYIYQALFDWGYFVRLMYLALRYRIVLYQAEFPAYAQACIRASRLLRGKTLLVEHNVECDRIKAQYPEVSQQAYEWLRDQEVGLCNQVDKVVAVSQPDRDLLIGHGVNPDKVHVIPHGVDLGAFEKSYEFSLRDAYGVPADTRIILYHGIYSYKPNLESIRILAKEILPRLRVRGWKAKVFAIGPEAPLEEIDPDVVFTGSVDQLAPYLKSGDLAVVPLQQGGGTRMKILEYFAASIPVVTTSKGVEGIPAENESQVLIEDTFDGMADAIIRLFEHPEEGIAMAERAKDIVERSDWRSIAEQYMVMVT